MSNRKQEAEQVLNGFVNLMADLLEDAAKEIEQSVTKGAQKAETEVDKFFKNIEAHAQRVQEHELMKQFKILEEIATLEAIKAKSIKLGVATKGFIKKVDNKLEVLTAQVR